jgi:hypothetical protein
MKKLIAITVFFALVAGAAFAQISVAGEALVTWKPLVGGGGVGLSDDADHGGFGKIMLDASGADDNGKFGAKVRFQLNPWWAKFGDISLGDGTVEGEVTGTFSGPVIDGTTDLPVTSGDYVDGEIDAIFTGKLKDTKLNWMTSRLVGANGYVWWQPIDQFKIIMGGASAGDGSYGNGGILGWDFYQTGSDMVNHENYWYASGAGGWGGGDGPAFMMEIKPMEAFGVNIAIPIAWGTLKSAFLGTYLEFNFTIGSIGKASVTYQLKDGSSSKNYGKANLYFNLTAINNLSLDIALSTELKTGPGDKIPLNFGLGATFNAGAFGVKARTEAQIAGKAFTMLFDVLPSYAITDSMKALFSAGMRFDKGGALQWHINPFLTIKSSTFWAPSFMAGLLVEGKTKGGGTTWSVPIGLNFGF